MTNTSPFDPSGSSPRVRGKPVLAVELVCRIRIIPARAGANGVWGTFNIRGHGSSPRVRGKHARRGVGGGEARIIPARAGQTCGTSHGIWFHPDHPRACGANGWVALNIACVRGSSPRVRGKPCGPQGTGGARRIIPARAGQTKGASCYEMCRTDHPRACGANSRDTTGVGCASGSSPRVRGKLGVTSPTTAQNRIIPARAGQTPAY